MSMEVDTKVVELAFENQNFEAGAISSMKTLDELSKKIDSLEGVGKSVEQLNTAMKEQKNLLEGMKKPLDALKKRFSFIGEWGRKLQNQVVSTVGTTFNDFVLDPISSGMSEYELKMKNILGILNNSAKDGYGLENVNEVLNDLNHYADKTIYSFRDMTDAVNRFVNAGVDLYQSKDAVQGISNMAAYMNASKDQASSAMLNFSQALSSGYMQLVDWKSIINAGMAGPAVEDLFVDMARLKGTDLLKGNSHAGKDEGMTIDELIDKYGSFKDTLKTGWLDAEMMMNGFQIFSGALTDEQLRAMGYTETEIADLIELGKTANDAATKVRSATDLVDTLKEAVQSGWTDSWEIVIGDLDEATELFTGISNKLGGYFDEDAQWRAVALKAWKGLGGRDTIIQAANNLIDTYMKIGKAFKTTLSDIIFGTDDPEWVGFALNQWSKEILKFTENLDHWFNDPVLLGEEGATFSRLEALQDILSGFAIVVQETLGWVEGLASAIWNGFTVGNVNVGLGAMFDWLLTKGSALSDILSWFVYGANNELRFGNWDWYKILFGYSTKEKPDVDNIKTFEDAEKALGKLDGLDALVVKSIIKLDTISKEWKAKWTEFKEGMGTATKVLGDVWGKVTARWPEVWKATKENMGESFHNLLLSIFPKAKAEDETAKVEGESWAHSMGTKIGTFFTTIGTKLSEFVDTAFSWISDPKTGEKISAAVDNITKFITEIPSKWETAKNGWEGIVNFFKGLFKGNGGENGESWFGRLLNLIIPKAGAEEATGEGVDLIEKLGELEPVVDKAVEVAEKLTMPREEPAEGQGRSVLDVIGEFFSGMDEWMENFDPDKVVRFLDTKVLPIAQSIATIYLTFSGGKMMRKFGEFAEDWGNVGESVTGALDAFKDVKWIDAMKSIGENGLAGVAEAIKTLKGEDEDGEDDPTWFDKFMMNLQRIGILAMEIAATMWVLSKVDADKLQASLIPMSEILAVIGTFYGGIAMINKFAPVGTAISGSTLVGMAAAVGILVWSVKQLEKLTEVNPSATMEAVGEIIALLFGESGAMVMFSKLANPGISFGGVAITVIAMAIATKLLVGAVAAMEALVAKDPVSTLIAYAEVLGMLGVEGVVIAAIGGVTAGLGAFVGAGFASILIAWSVGMLVDVIDKMATIDERTSKAEEAWAQVAILFGESGYILAALGGVTAAGSTFAGMGVAALGITLGVWILTAAIDNMARIIDENKADTVRSAFLMVEGLFGTEGIVLVALGHITNASAPFLGMGIAAAGISFGVWMLSNAIDNMTRFAEANHDFDDVAAAFLAVGGLLVGEGVVLWAMKGISASAGSMIGAGIACVMISFAVGQLTGTLEKMDALNQQYGADHNWTGITQTLTMLAGETGAVALIGAVMGVCGTHFLALAGSSLAMGALSATVDALAGVVGKLDQLIIEDGADTVQSSVGYLVSIIGTETTGIVGIALACKLLAGITVIEAAKMAGIMAMITAVAVGIPTLAGAIDEISNGGFTDLLDKGIDVATKTGQFFGSLVGGMAGGFQGAQAEASADGMNAAAEVWNDTFDRLGSAFEKLSGHTYDTKQVTDAITCMAELNKASQGLQAVDTSWFMAMTGESGIRDWLNAMIGDDQNRGIVGLMQTLGDQIKGAKIDNWEDIKATIGQTKTLMEAFQGEMPEINPSWFSVFTGDKSVTSLLRAFCDPDIGIVGLIKQFDSQLNGQNVNWEAVTSAINAYHTIAESIHLLGDSTAAFIDAVELSEAISMLAGADFAGLAGAVARAGNEANLSFQTEFEAALANAALVLQTQIPVFEQVGSDTIAAVATSISHGQSLVEGAVGDIVVAIESYYDQFYGAGVYIGEGFVAGISSMDWQAYDAGWGLSDSGLMGIEERARIASPSKEAIEDGAFIGEGLSLGIIRKLYEVWRAGKEAASAALDGIETVKTPTITPVVEAGDAKVEAVNLAKWFTEHVKVHTNSIGNIANKYRDSKVSIDENLSVKSNERAAKFSDGLELLSKKLDNLTVVMDSGELVGAISNKVDTSLGSITFSKKRGG